MRNLAFSAAILLLGVVANSHAADLNGYSAQYECRAGSPNCNVDVAALSTRACDQTVSPSTPWSSINWANNTICIQAGDHTAKGTLTLGSSGTSGTRKVLRYTRTSDSDDEPWGQSDGNRAKIHVLNTDARSYWVVHRITFPPSSENGISRVNVSGASTNLIFNRILIEGNGAADNCYGGFVIDGSSFSVGFITLQNSVVRDARKCTFGSPVAVNMQLGNNNRVVNNEIYNWCEHQIQIGHNNVPTITNLVVENNDLYLSGAMYNSNGDAAAGWLLSIKATASTSEPIKIINNRLWGTRPQTASLCGTPDSASAIGFNANTGGLDTKFTMIRNNIITDSVGGISAYNNKISRHSIIGNIFYDIGLRGTSLYSSGISFYSLSETEVYLNSLISVVGANSGNTDNGSMGQWGWAQNLDIRCNALIGSGAVSTDSLASNSVADYNAFYGTTSFGFNGTNTNVAKSISTRVNSAAYSPGQVVRTTSTPPENGTAGDFLYIVTNGGTTASAAPEYCTTLGCTTNDGSATVRAIRGPYTYYRKLRTSPERHTIPYARAHASAPEAYGCPSDYARRFGIGIND